MITVGILSETFNGTSDSPIIAVNSSLTIETICWAGFNPSNTLAPAAFSRTLRTKSLTTVKLTSASNNAKRISRIVSRKSASVTFPLRRNPLNAFCNRSVKPSKAMLYSSSNVTRRSANRVSSASLGYFS